MIYLINNLVKKYTFLCLKTQTCFTLNSKMSFHTTLAAMRTLTWAIIAQGLDLSNLGDVFLSGQLVEHNEKRTV
jgi:hypothetical protein